MFPVCAWPPHDPVRV